MPPRADGGKTALPPTNVGFSALLSLVAVPGGSSLTIAPWRHTTPPGAASSAMVAVPLKTLLLAGLGLVALILIIAAVALFVVLRRREGAAERRIADATEQSRREIAASEARYMSLFENAALPLFEEDFSEVKRRIDRATREGEELERFLSPEGQGVRECAALVRVLAINNETRRYFGLDSAVGDGAELPNFFGPESWEPFSRELVALMEGQTRFEAHFPIVSFAQEPRDAIVRVSVAPGAEEGLDRVLVSLLDITPLKATEDALRRSLAENRALLRELYHRTRNNLQVVCSMLNMESLRLSDEKAVAALRETEERIQAMALIHERLSATGDLSRVEMADYISNLAELLMRSHGVDGSRVRVQIESDDVRLAIDQAVPCGMVLNELVTNALKHAFPAGRSGTILIGLRLREEDKVELVVEDDGVGVPPGWDSRASSSMGLQNVFLIGEGQLQGSITVDLDSGLRWRILFPLLS